MGAFSLLLAMVGTLLAGAWPAEAASTVDRVAREIRAEATRGNTDRGGRPLPLAAHWNTGQRPNGFDPAYQLRMIARGHHLLPWLQLPSPDQTEGLEYYEIPVRMMAELRLPLSFVSTQWEHRLTDDKAYFDLPADRNPNVVDPEGKVRREVCPFGPVAPWRAVGQQWTTSPILRLLQLWYPNPPRVLFISNNEHSKLTWSQVEQSARYLERHGKGRNDTFKRQVVAEGWIERYRALQAGMRDGLTQARWRQNALFVGYEAFGPAHLGHWEGWEEYSLWTPGRIDPAPLAWDGGSPSLYTHNWNASTDYTVWSPQVEAMNWVPMLAEAHRLNPRFWFELSTWDGHEPTLANDKRKVYAQAGQTASPERYGGMVQFGMWLLCPRAVREFRGWTDTVANAEPYFLPILAAVDRVYHNPILRRFWRQSQLVPNRAHPHPYAANLPPDYRAADRWFLLDTDLDPPRPWTLSTEIPVFALARVLGQPGGREWLIYAHAPLGERQGVTVTLPEYGQVRIDVTPAGVFYHLRERGRRLQRVL